MNTYEKQVDKELKRWYAGIVKSAGLIERTTGGIQKKMQNIVPQKLQNAITIAIEAITKAVMSGSGFLTNLSNADTSGLSLAERDYIAMHHFKAYDKTATIQGIGFGMGGILLGLADFPVFMSIKFKFIFDAAKIYGFDPEDPSERLFILHVFQLAFSGKEHRLNIFRKLESWDENPHNTVDWEKFQIEYRDYIDIAKLLQLMPVIGAAAGGAANHKLMRRLRENVMNCYRMRILGRRFK